MQEKITDKAGDMFLKYGFKSVTMDDIANEMGISKKTIYKYFDNKDHLVDETVAYVQKTIDAIIEDIMSKDYNAIEENFAIKNVFKNMFKNAKTSPMFQLKKYYPETYAKLMDREICTFSECVITNLEKGISEKLYRENIDKEMVMKFYFTLVFGAYESDLFDHNLSEVVKTEVKILEYHTRAIATLYGHSILEQQLIKYKENQS
ncbi:TetR/AcrR family transcriptional regulator [Winogradskyella sp.]|jgi:AcrR family transcriptional regulator|uniref:TetR/AcrR family transcriptional regulator n=1 Tax=Winogradskyella sp. TaxID=1883156 RepID=UPI0025D9860C|nr:TetR/AcrR family transcriptional regulator [Winogradskyella sp.]MCT4630312.1 TetR/AcrR family transcriptional regulator [Winogradskyella sp.]